MQTELFNQQDTILPIVEEEQPSYKAVTMGLSALSNIELLCLLVQGNGRNALEGVRAAFHKAKNNLNELTNLSLHDLTAIPGIGKAKALSIIAALELGKRRTMQGALAKKYVQSSADIAEYLRAYIGNDQTEKFVVIFTNRANKINHIQTISEGGISGTVADPRIILRLALEHRAVNIILSHNHPSGSLRPSRADEQITSKIKEAAKYFDINVMDHIIVAETGYYSFADEGLL